ncbi:MAG: hypothetical protein J6B75_05150 [Ruminococcus sp.]|nr:hypothetical protein [Ruminococcus sp.]
MSVYEKCREDKKGVQAAPKTAGTERKPQNTGNDLIAGIDRDTLLTAAVMLLMIRNGGDIRLILALGYIIVGGGKK